MLSELIAALMPYWFYLFVLCVFAFIAVLTEMIWRKATAQIILPLVAVVLILAAGVAWGGL